MIREVVIVGCGGHGREALGIVRAVNDASPDGPVWRVRGFVADRLSDVARERIHRLGVPYLGSLDELRDLAPGVHVIVAVGDPRDRRAVWQRIEPFGVAASTVVHPAARLAAGTVPGDGLLAFAGATVATNVTIGRHVHLNQNASVGSDCVLADYVSVHPLAAVSGRCRVDEGALVGACAVVLSGRHIGRDATVGAQARVTRDVHRGTVVKGVPAR